MEQPSELQNFSIEEITWEAIVNDVASINKEFVKAINNLTTNKKLTIFKASYIYGAEIFHNGIFHLPLKDGKTVPINSSSVPYRMRKRLGYGVMPAIMAVNKNCEVFADFATHFTPFQVLTPGETAGTWEIHEDERSKSLTRTRPCTITSGIRTAVMLPGIAITALHDKLRSRYKFNLPPPKYFFDHHGVFKKIAQHPNFPEKWYSTIIIFPEEWLSPTDGNNLELASAFRYFLLKEAWRQTIKWRNYQDISLMWQSFSADIEEMKNIPRLYVVDTVKRLLLIGLGGYPAFAPSIDSKSLPLQGLQKAYQEEYKLEQYIPTIFESQHMLHNCNSQPLYYSLQCPTLIEYSQVLSRSRSAMQDLENVKFLMDLLLEKLKKSKNYALDPVRNLKFDYYHTEKSCYQDIKQAKNIIAEDTRLQQTTYNKIKNLESASKASFLRGCIKIQFQI